MARVLGPYRETMRHIQASQWRAWTEEGQPFWIRLARELHMCKKYDRHTEVLRLRCP